MNDACCRLPADLGDDIDAYESDVHRFLAGELPAGHMKAKRVPRGVYEQRRDGTHMVRVRVAGGVLPAAQARELAALADEFGDGRLHVTTRQDVQIHDVALERTPEVMRRLLAVGLTSKGGGGNTVRNVAACPFAGTCPHERFDVTPFAHAVTEYLIALVGSYNLPRKYKIAFSGCAADCALAQVADLGFLAASRDGEAGFRVVAGGGMGARSRIAEEIIDWVPAAEVIRLAEAVRRLFDRLGDRKNRARARLRYVFERLGLDAVRDELDREREAVARDGVPAWKGEVALHEPASAGPPAERIVDGVRCVLQAGQGLVTVPLHLPLGFVSSADFARIGEVAARFSREGGLRTTRRQDLLMRSVEEDEIPALAGELRGLSIDLLAPAALERFVACAGASTCRLGLCLARGAARSCADALTDAGLDAETLDDLEIYINGCPNACGHQPIGPIGFSGVAERNEGRPVPGYRVTLGGRCGAEGARFGTPVGRVPARALPAFLVDLVGEFRRGRRKGETFAAYVERTGEACFSDLVERHATVPSYRERPEFYRDLGAGEEFSLAGRGAGECGAGVFEVIRADLAAARSAEAPYDILLPTARALLITRGIDVTDADGVFREFERHFIETGLVAEEFRGLLARARGGLQGWEGALDNDGDAVHRLRNRVELLFATLDGSLEFHPDEAAAPGSADAGADASTEERTVVVESTLDLSGVACPMNFVKTKLRLERMNAGERLAVVLDGGAPIENVPASLREQGQEVEEITDLGDGHWRMIVRKMQ